jgi:hypothetical protein
VLREGQLVKPVPWHPFHGSRPTPRITRRPKRWQVDNNRRVGGRVHALVRLRAIFSSPVVTRFVRDGIRPAPCLPPPACAEVRPFTTAGDALIRPLRHPIRPLIQSAESSNRNSNLTLRITRRPKRWQIDNNRRVGGRVHALVRPRCHIEVRRSAPPPSLATDDETR